MHFFLWWISTEKPRGRQTSKGGIGIYKSMEEKGVPLAEFHVKHFLNERYHHQLPDLKCQIITSKTLCVRKGRFWWKFLTWGKMRKRFQVFVCHDSISMFCLIYTWTRLEIKTVKMEMRCFCCSDHTLPCLVFGVRRPILFQDFWEDTFLSLILAIFLVLRNSLEMGNHGELCSRPKYKEQYQKASPPESTSFCWNRIPKHLLCQE